jgi:hypothetical protein
MKKLFALISLMMVMLLIGMGCGDKQQSSNAIGSSNLLKNAMEGTETLGDPGIAIAEGSGIVVAGTGMVSQPATIDINVPGTMIKQVLLYWSGGTTEAPYLDDDEIIVDGVPITGTLIGGPTYFFEDYYFNSYRADITGLGLVGLGANSLTLEGMLYVGPTPKENSGAGIVVIYDDGSVADIQLRDGIDLAFFDFPEPRQTTVPQTFYFDPAATNRVADIFVMCGSVGENRPNEIKVNVNGIIHSFINQLSAADGEQWDTKVVSVDVLAGDTMLTVEVISTESYDPLGASLTWIVGGFSLPLEVVRPASLGDWVWEDMNNNGIQDDGEPGIEGVTVNLYDCQDNLLATTVTDADGLYLFFDLMPGGYYVEFITPMGYVFSPQDQGMDDALDSDADPQTGKTICIDLEAGEDDMTWDAGLYMPPMEGCTRTIGYWKNWTGLGPQDDMMSALLPIWLGDAGGSKSIPVTTVEIAVDVLTMKTYGKNNNGITKLYAQLLAAKLNISNGASGMDVADIISDADAFLADNDWNDWGDLSDADKGMVMGWQGDLDDYNNGLIGPGHCDDMDDYDMDR